MRQSCDHRSVELTMPRFAQRATSFLMWIISRFQMMSQFTSTSQIILAADYNSRMSDMKSLNATVKDVLMRSERVISLLEMGGF